MIGKLLGLLWMLVTLPIKLLMLPFKIASAIVSIVFYTTLLLILGAIVAVVFII